MRISFFIRFTLSPLCRLLDLTHSTCFRCRQPWGFVSLHSTQFSDVQGCFPLCESCWKELGSPEKRLPFYHVWWGQVLAKAVRYGIEYRSEVAEWWPRIEAAVLKGD